MQRVFNFTGRSRCFFLGFVLAFLSCSSHQKNKPQKLLRILPPKAHQSNDTSLFKYRVKSNNGVVQEIELANGADINEIKIDNKTFQKKSHLSYLEGLKKIEVLFNQENYYDALTEIEKMIKLYPKKERLYAMQGTLYRKINEYKDAIDAYKKAIAQNPDNILYEQAILELEMMQQGNQL